MAAWQRVSCILQILMRALNYFRVIHSMPNLNSLIRSFAFWCLHASLKAVDFTAVSEYELFAATTPASRCIDEHVLLYPSQQPR
ncbi:hypothetical protein VNO77_05485 [Canavalia gladiata]|uniref:Uncharacterized protein n=1 Tax=Canavalia gladiata TaxID=3824 RepID=A0AAN9MYG2_CANGL